MSKPATPPLELPWPCYGACFSVNNTIVAAGGGGAGNHGIPNRLAVLKVANAAGQLDIEYNKDLPPRKLQSGDTVNEEALRVSTPSNPHPPHPLRPVHLRCEQMQALRDTGSNSQQAERARANPHPA